MSPVRATAPALLRPDAINELALNTTLYYAADLSFKALDIGLSGALFGVLTLLVILAVVFLTRKGLRFTYVRILLPSTLILYTSTALYTAALASHITSVNRLVTQAQGGLFSDAFTTADVDRFESDVLKQSWMMTAAVIVNVMIGDSIVWWRVCVVWRNRIVYYIGPLLIVLIIGFGAKTISGVHHCAHSCRQPQFLFSTGAFADIFTTLSLAINLLATGLIGYKTWVHWRLHRKQLGRSHRNSQVVKALALLLESGAIYCILVLIMVAFEASPALFDGPEVHQNAFLRTLADYTYACFIYVIAIYPVLIIVVVTLNVSPIERGLNTDSTFVESSNGNGRPSTHLGSIKGTKSTPVVTDTAHVRCAGEGEVGALEGHREADSASPSSTSETKEPVQEA